jgi:hypothetical protein
VAIHLVLAQIADRRKWTIVPRDKLLVAKFVREGEARVARLNELQAVLVHDGHLRSAGLLLELVTVCEHSLELAREHLRLEKLWCDNQRH